MSNLPTVQSEKFTGKEIDLLRNTYAKGLSDTELSLFLKQAEAMNLNPFTKEIYGMVVAGKLTLITSIAGLRKIAHQSGNYLGCSVVVKMNGSVPVSAEATVKKFVAGREAEFKAEVFFSEYNSGQFNWKKMPITMLKKVAEAHALRMAYPTTENLYEESEVGAINRSRGESERAAELTEKFQAVEPREVTPHPDIDNDLPLSLASDESTDDVDNPVDSVDNNPGEYVIGIGKNTGKKIKDIAKEDLEGFLKWAYSQEKLSPKAEEYVTFAENYLGKK